MDYVFGLGLINIIPEIQTHPSEIIDQITFAEPKNIIVKEEEEMNNDR